jgi:hypothetical protein
MRTGDAMSTDLSEFTTTLEQEGASLRLPLGERLAMALERFGFRPGQKVLVRFGQQRLQVLPCNTTQEVRDHLALAAQALRQVEGGMREQLIRLPTPSDEQLENEETSLEGELQGLLECLLADNLVPAIDKLESADRLGTPPGQRRG